MKRLFATWVLLLCCLAAGANDGTYYTSGNHLVPLIETDISVRKEVLTIWLTDSGYARVDVYYEFWNPNPTVRSVLMGFEADRPYNAFGYNSNGVHPYISSFGVEMNGSAIAHKNALCHAGLGLSPIDTSKRYQEFHGTLIDAEIDPDKVEDWDSVNKAVYTYVYYFTADFEPGLNKVHHTYSYQMDVTNYNAFGLSYMLSPAARWANHQIDDFTLVIRADGTAKHFSIGADVFPAANYQVVEGTGKIRRTMMCDRLDSYEFSLRNGAVALHLKDFKPEKELHIEAQLVYDCGPWHLGITYDRTCEWPLILNSHDEHPAPADSAFFRRVAHNLPFAHRGHVFKDKKLKQYFESLWWYMPDPDYKDDTTDFTEADWEYLRFEW